LTIILITWNITAIFFWLKWYSNRKSFSSNVVLNGDFFLLSSNSFVRYSAVFGEKSQYSSSADLIISFFSVFNRFPAVISFFS
jgi:hypothetical protein